MELCGGSLHGVFVGSNAVGEAGHGVIDGMRPGGYHAESYLDDRAIQSRGFFLEKLSTAAGDVHREPETGRSAVANTLGDTQAS